MVGLDEAFQRGQWSPAIKAPREEHKQARSHRRWAGGEGASLTYRREEGGEMVPQPSTVGTGPDPISTGPIGLDRVGTRPGLEMCGCSVGSSEKPQTVL